VAAALTLTLANTTTQFAPRHLGMRLDGARFFAPGHRQTMSRGAKTFAPDHSDERSNPLAVSYSIALISSSRAALVKEDQECSLKRVAPQGYFCRFY